MDSPGAIFKKYFLNKAAQIFTAFFTIIMN